LFVGAEEGSFEAAVCTALSLAGMLLQLEIGTHKNLLNHFGGGYELISPQRDHFVLCDDILYAFWAATIDNEGVTILTMLDYPESS
jgi:hypothetical protein